MFIFSFAQEYPQNQINYSTAAAPSIVSHQEIQHSIALSSCIFLTEGPNALWRSQRTVDN